MLIKTLLWIKQYKAQVAAGLLVAALAGFVSSAFFIQRRDNVDKGWEIFSLAQFLAANGKPQEAHQILAQLKTNPPSGALSDYALFAEGIMLTHGGAHTQALANFDQLLTRSNVEKIKPLALLGSARAQEIANALDKARDAYQSFIAQYGDHFGAPEAYENLARLSETLGNREQAVENLERLRVLYPDTVWSRRAEARLKLLSGNPSK
jgi:tetratricopeptide (TPR) repeat protein